MRVCVLGSGSSGNCTLVEGPGGIVLLDVGFSPRETRRRMESAGFRPADVGAVVLTHPDSDHLHSGWTRALGGLAGPRLVVRPRHAAAVASMGYLPAWIDEEPGAFERCGLAFEAFPLFAAAVIIAHLAGAAQSTVDALALAFVVLRAGYVLAYIHDWPTLRSLLWIAAIGCVVGLFVASA